MAKTSIIVSIGKNRVIGRKDGLIWPIPDDLRHFKELTMGHPVVMGRKTFASILARLGKPLPGRTNIVLARDEEHYAPEGVVVAHSVEEALAKAREVEQEEIFIGGGAEIYRQLLPLADRLYLTLVDDEKEGDAFFPLYEHLFSKEVSKEDREFNGLRYSWVTLEK